MRVSYRVQERADLMAYAFRDPLEATDDLRRRSPVHESLQISVVRQEQGMAVLSMPLTENLRGPAEGSIHGGMLATLADAASGFCLEGCFELGSEFPVTTDMDVRYFRQPKGGPLVAEAVMVHEGRRLLSSECTIVDAEQRVLARSTATYMIVPIGDADSKKNTQEAPPRMPSEYGGPDVQVARWVRDRKSVV